MSFGKDKSIIHEMRSILGMKFKALFMEKENGEQVCNG